MEQGKVDWDGERAPGQRERYLSQGRGLLSSIGTTLWVLLPASKHMARRVSSFVLGSSCNLSRSRMPSTISSTCRVEPGEPQSFLLFFLPCSSLSTHSSDSRDLVAILSVTLVPSQSSGVPGARPAGAAKGTPKARAKVPYSKCLPTASKSREELPAYSGDTRPSTRKAKA